MPMLLDRAAELAAKIITHQKLKGTADEADQFETRANQFAERVPADHAATRHLAALADAGVAITFVPSDGVGYAAKASVTAPDAIKTDPARSTIHRST